MIENLLHLIVGFVATYLSLEVAWYYTASRVKEDNNKKKNNIKPCMFKEIKTILVVEPQVASTGGKP